MAPRNPEQEKEILTVIMKILSVNINIFINSGLKQFLMRSFLRETLPRFFRIELCSASWWTRSSLTASRKSRKRLWNEMNFHQKYFPLILQGPAFMLMENVQSFLNAAKKYGVPDEEVFQTPDLFEARNIPQVSLCIFSLGETHQKW